MDSALRDGLPAEAYTSQAIFEVEKQRIFYRQWYCLGHSEHVREPGCYLTGQVADQSVFAMRGDDGVLRAFYNVCQHRAHELFSDAKGQRKAIICPYHAWTYSREGLLLSARGCQKYAAPGERNRDLKQIHVGEVCGFVFVSLAPAMPLREYTAEWEAKLREFGPRTEHLTTIFETMHDVRCNWKLLIENSMECGHCEVAHPAFCKQVRLNSYEVNHDPWTRMTFASGLMQAGAINERAANANSDENLVRFGYLYLWPGTEARIVAGNPNFLMRRQVPLAPDLTRVYNTLYYTSKEECDIEAYRDSLHDPTFAEDIQLVESAQRGMNSRGFERQTFMRPPKSRHYSEDDLETFNLRVAEAIGLDLDASTAGPGMTDASPPRRAGRA